MSFQIAAREKTREPCIGSAILRIGEDIRRAVTKNEPATDGDVQSPRLNLIFACEEMRAHDAGERITVGDTKASQAELIGVFDEFFRMRGAAQE